MDKVYSDRVYNRNYRTKQIKIVNFILLSKLVATVYRAFWSGFFRLIFGEDWIIRHKKYTIFEQAHHLFDKYFLHYYVRRIGYLAQTRLPDGIMLQPYDSLFINRDIYRSSL